jgi:FkbM family methyltransferase
MRLFIEKTLRMLYSSYLFPGTRISYSQNGEDLIVKDLFSKLGIKNPSYLDIGANDPVFISNTYLLYSKGSKGVCIEPNEYLYRKLKRIRTEDICLNAGVAFNERTEADFYLFPKAANGLGTFSKKEADFWQNVGTKNIGKYKVERILKLQLLNINEIIKKYFKACPNFISMDVEGLDFQILKTLDFNEHTPEVICVETIDYGANNSEIKDKELISFVCSKGYFVYADTYINTIFCKTSSYISAQNNFFL